MTIALHRPVLVDDDGHVLVLLAELGQQRREILRLGDDVDGTQELRDLDLGDSALVQRGEQIAHVEDADDLVERVAVDGIARVRRLEHRSERLLGGHVGLDRDHLRPRDHHLVHLLVGEVEDLVEHLALPVLDLAGLARDVQQHLQLGLGVHLVLRARRLKADPAQHGGRHVLEKPDERREEHEEAPHGRRDGQRGPLRVAERDALRHELADHDVQRRDHDEGDHDRQDRREHRVEQLGQNRLAEGADAEARERDAELHRGDEAWRARDDLEHVARAPVALLLELDDLRAPRRHEAVLGRDEEPVQQHQPDEGEQLEEDRHAPLSGAWVLGGSSSSKLGRSIGNDPDVLVPFGPILEHEPLEVGERLGDGEPPRGGLQVRAEEVERELVARARAVGERGLGHPEPLAVVLDQLVCAPHGILDRLAVTGQSNARRELDRALERPQVVAERVGPARGPEADRRRDSAEQVVGRDEHADP